MFPGAGSTSPTRDFALSGPLRASPRPSLAAPPGRPRYGTAQEAVRSQAGVDLPRDRLRHQRPAQQLSGGVSDTISGRLPPSQSSCPGQAEYGPQIDVRHFGAPTRSTRAIGVQRLAQPLYEGNPSGTSQSLGHFRRGLWRPPGGHCRCNASVQMQR